MLKIFITSVDAYESRAVRISCKFSHKNQEFLEKVQQLQVPVLVLVNKIDLSEQKLLADKVDQWHAVLPQAEIIPISALHRFNVDVVLRRIQELLPESPAYFDKEQWTDKPARFFVTEIIREKILLYYNIPCFRFRFCRYFRL